MVLPSEPKASPAARSGAAIRGGAIRVAGYGAGVLVSLGSATILVRHLGISSFGRYVTVTSLVGVVGGVTEAGIYLFGIREYAARGADDRRSLMADLLGLRLALTLVGIVGALCFAVAAGYRGVLILGTVIAGAGLLVQVAADVLSIPWQAQLQLGRLTVIDLIRRTLTLLFIAVLAVLGAAILPFFGASAAAGAVALCVLAWSVRRFLTLRLSFDWRAWRRLFADGLPLALSISIGAIYIYLTVIIMSLIASATQTGLFATSFRVTQVTLAVPGLLLTAIFPLVARARDRLDPPTGDMIGKVFAVAAICGVWMALAMVLGAPFIMDVVAGTKGRAAVSVLRIQGILLAVSFVSTSSSLVLASLRRHRSFMIACSLVLVLNVALAVILVPPLGARGGALGDVLAETVMAFALTGLLMRAVPQHQIKFSVLGPVALAAAVSAGVWLAPIGSLPRVAVATIVYFGVLLRLRAIPDEVIEAAQRVWPVPRRA